MRRNNDLIREMLFEFEKQDDYLVLIPTHLSMSIKERERFHHVELLCDQGLMVQVSNSGYRITAQGHDFIEAVRDEGIWSKTKQVVAETGGNATLEIVKAVAVGFLKKKMSQHTGIEL